MALAKMASPGVSESIIAPSDLLEVTVATGREEESKPTTLRVSDDGTVDVPIIGPVPVAGLEALEASKSITSLAIQRGMYRHPLVTVEIKSKAVNRITVLGAVKEPGTYELPRGGSDLVAALAAAGGVDEEAGTVVEIVRQPKFRVAGDGQQQPQANPTEPSSEVQLAAYQNVGNDNRGRQAGGWSAPVTQRLDLSGGQPTSYTDLRLGDRDVVRMLPREQEVIHVTGLVTNPGQFDLPHDQDIHLLDAIALAGGSKSPVADKVFVIRRLKNRPEPLVIQASLSKAKQDGMENLRLAPGDTVSIEQTPATAVVDTLSKFFRLSFGVASGTVF